LTKNSSFNEKEAQIAVAAKPFSREQVEGGLDMKLTN